MNRFSCSHNVTHQWLRYFRVLTKEPCVTRYGNIAKQTHLVCSEERFTPPHFSKDKPMRDMHRHQDHAPDKACLIQFTFVIKNLSTKNRNVTRSGNTTCTKTACLMMPSVRGAAHGATERERFFTVCSKRAHSAYTLASQALPSNGDTSLLHIIFPFGLCST